MIWRRARDHYDFAIRWWVRRYLRLTFLWRMLLAWPSMILIGTAAALIAGVLLQIGPDSESWRRFLAFLVGISTTAGFFLPLLDYALESNAVSQDTKRFFSHPGTILATRAEYLGGHVNFPHGRFAYVTINGQRANPYLTIHWQDHPRLTNPPPLFVPPWTPEFPSISLRDVERAEAAHDPEQDLAVLVDRRFGRFSGGPRLALEVRYTGPGSRRFRLELSNFWGGQEDIRALRNTVVCAVAEAEGAITIKPPWKSLPLIDAIEQPPETTDDNPAWRRPLPPDEYRRAFRRV